MGLGQQVVEFLLNIGQLLLVRRLCGGPPEGRFPLALPLSGGVLAGGVLVGPPQVGGGACPHRIRVVLRIRHKAGAEVGYCQIEKLQNLDRLPATGFTVACFPTKVRGASAGWTRAVAIIDN